MSSLGPLVVVGVLLVGCGGRASSSGPNGSDTEQGGSNGSLPAGGRASDAGGASIAGKAASASGGASGSSTVLLVDDEVERDGRPSGPSSAGFFWGSQVGGWRLGNWFLTSDTIHDVELSPFAPPRDGSMQARHVSGAGFESGVVLWAELDHPFHRPVDLSAYVGITFWARLESKSGVLAVAMEGTQSSPDPKGWEKLPVVVSLDVGPNWQQFTLPFEDLVQGEPTGVSIDFFVGANGEAFDLWIDDFAFLCAGPCL